MGRLVFVTSSTIPMVKSFFWCVKGKILIDGKHLIRRRVFGRKTITAADDGDIGAFLPCRGC